MKEEIPITDYGKEVKIRLIQRDMSQVELMDKIREKTGLYVDSPYLARIFNGQRNAPKIVEAINEILNINDELIN